MLSLGRNDGRKSAAIYIEEKEFTVERKTTRVLKGPEVRRQKILDTTMKVPMEKGYEAATIRNIAAVMNVVPGLCYRYFESKQVLYDTVVEQYMKEIALPMIHALEEGQDKTEESLGQFLNSLEQLLLGTDGRERYRHFFHKRGNRHLQMLLSVRLCEAICPHLESRSERMRGKGMMKAESLSLITSYLLFGVAPAIENDGFSPRGKVARIKRIHVKVLNP